MKIAPGLLMLSLVCGGCSGPMAEPTSTPQSVRQLDESDHTAIAFAVVAPLEDLGFPTFARLPSDARPFLDVAVDISSDPGMTIDDISELVNHDTIISVLPAAAHIVDWNSYLRLSSTDLSELAAWKEPAG